MKKLFLSLFAFAVMGGAAQAQCCYDVFSIYQIIESWEEGGVEVKFTEIDGNLAPIYGIKGGWFLWDENLLFGTTANFSYSNWSELQSTPTTFTMYYGGIYLDINHTPHRPIHMNTNITFGLGAAETTGPEPFQNGLASFFLIEPNANMKMKLTSWCKLGVGGGYRYALGTGSEYLRARDISGPSFNIMLLFGDY